MWSPRTLAHCLLIAVTVLHASCHAAVSKCKNRLDLAIVVDCTSSESASSFEEVKTQVKKIFSEFKIGMDHTRLALISATGQVAQVLANFNVIGSLSDFNSAVDRVTFGTGPADLAAAMQTARLAVLSSARTGSTSKAVILVKDRRQPSSEGASSVAARARISSEAAAVRSAGATIQAVGIGGLWFSEDLEALFGTEYLLFKNVIKATESIKSLNNLVCQASCPDAGKILSKSGLCHLATKQVFKTSVQLAVDSSGLSVCRKEIEANFESCSSTIRCNEITREVGECSSEGKVRVQNSWKIFDLKTLECVQKKTVTVVDCKDALKCTGQMADVIFILDRSSSLFGQFEHVREATRVLMEPLDVGPSSARVALMTFENSANMVASLDASSNLKSLLAALDSIPGFIASYGKLTFTDRALTGALKEFQTNGRSEVPRFVFLVTDGASTNQQDTFDAVSKIKNNGVNVIAIGVGSVNKTELETMTAPDSATNLVILKDLAQLKIWSKEFAKQICIRLAAPDPKLCEDNVFVQTISECFNNKQQVTKTEYVFDSHRNCIKSIQSRLFQHCRTKCIDPINGNEYFQGDAWTTRCHQFQCGSSPVKPFLPARSDCVSATGECHVVGAKRFSCTDEKGATYTDCQCLEKNGRPTVVIDSN